jgi:uncharacterized protein
MVPNPYLLAADNSPALLPLLRENPALASAQDEHGYSLIHAAASYNHLDLLRTLVREFKVDVNIKDEDQETALFVVESVDAARVLIEELNSNISFKGCDNLTAREKIEAEGDFPDVAEYLRLVEIQQNISLGRNCPANETQQRFDLPYIPPPPPGLEVRIGTMSEQEDTEAELNPEFRARIDELAQREDFNTAEGQAELRQLVEDAVFNQQLGDDRNVRPRQT